MFVIVCVLIRLAYVGECVSYPAHGGQSSFLELGLSYHLHRFWVLNSGPQACVAAAFTTVPSLHPCVSVFAFYFHSSCDILVPQ